MIPVSIPVTYRGREFDKKKYIDLTLYDLKSICPKDSIRALGVLKLSQITTDFSLGLSYKRLESS